VPFRGSRHPDKPRRPIAEHCRFQHSRAWHTINPIGFRSEIDPGLLAWLRGSFLPAARPTFALSPRLGLVGAADRTSALHLSAAVHRFIGVSVCASPTTVLSLPARLDISQGNGLAECRRRTRRVASLRLWFPSTSANRRPASCARRPALSLIPLQRLLRSCGFGRHSSSSAAELCRAGDRGTERRSCVTGLFLGGVPLSVPCGLDLVGDRAPL
jgi:hypothetical protein